MGAGFCSQQLISWSRWAHPFHLREEPGLWPHTSSTSMAQMGTDGLDLALKPVPSGQLLLPGLGTYTPSYPNTYNSCHIVRCTKKGLIPDPSLVIPEHQHKHLYFNFSWGFGTSSGVKADLSSMNKKTETTPILSASKGTPYGNLSALRSCKNLHSKIMSVLKSYLETSSFLRALSDKQSWPLWCSQGTVLAFAQKHIKTRLLKLPPLNGLQKPLLFLFIKSHCLGSRKERVGIIFIFSRSA